MKRWLKRTSMILAMTMLLGGCSNTGQTKSGPEKETEERTMYVVDEKPRTETMLIQEVPAITAEPLLANQSDWNVSAVAARGEQQDMVYPAPGTGSGTGQKTAGTAAQLPVYTPQKVSEVKAVWISYLELDGLLKGKTQKQFTQGISGVFDNVKNFGLNTVIVQVRPFADALYQSDYFPWSYLASGAEGVDPGFDPLGIMVEEAHARGLRIDAWLNPYRVRNSGSKIALSSDNKAREWLSANNGSVAKAADGTIVFNPASVRAQELIVNGVREIVQKYDVDGIHIDDYFYPTTGTSFDKTFDAASYTAYQNNGGKMTLENWRRGNVDALVKKMYAAIKEENPSVLFGISPQSSVNNNFNSLYLDIEKVLSNTGYCDYVCPQIYFGFDNDVQPFEKTVQQWSNMIKVDSIDLYVGIAAYKVGRVDSWAGGGKAEWQQYQDIMARQLTTSRAVDHYKGVVIYRYDSIFNPDSAVIQHVNTERGNLRKIL